MKKSVNRREFLKYSFQGLGVFTLLNSPLKLFANQTSSSTSTSSLDTAILYKQAKEYFRKKEYASSIEIYKQIIVADPRKIAYYDGYAKVLGAQQKTLEVAELFRAGLQKNPSNPHFKHRLSLSLRNLCTGNRKAEIAFVTKYGQANLMTLSATLLMEAVALKPIKGYMMDLRDFPVILENKNKELYEHNISLINVESSLINTIKSVSSSIDSKWQSTRKSRKPVISDVDTEVNSINNKTRHDLYFDNEKKSRTKETKKAVKNRWKEGLHRNIKLKDSYLVEKYGSLIVTDNFNDTDTIGKLRKYYKKAKTYDRIVNLNRNLYINNGNFVNALALASSLVTYSTAYTAITEAKQLLAIVKPYINTLASVNTTTYYLTVAQLNLKENMPSQARNTLLEGIKLYDGRGGLCYSLMEKYAMTYLENSAGKGVAIMKGLCNKELKDIDAQITTYVTNYRNSIKEKPLSIPEQIKGLNALAKLQKKAGSAEYASTLSEISLLRSKIVRI